MSTWLPYVSFRESARVLSRADLAEARVDAVVAVTALLEGRGDDVPEVWHGYGPALIAYVGALDAEFGERGYRRGKLWAGVLALAAERLGLSAESVEGTAHEDVLAMMDMLPELLTPVLCAGERRELLARDPVWYGQFGWREKPVAGGRVEQEPPRDELAERRAARSGEKERHTMATRTALVEDLRKRGYDGPVSYTKIRLEEMVATLAAGGTVEAPKRGRKPREAATNGAGDQEGD